MKEKLIAIVSKLDAVFSWRNSTLYWFILGVVALVFAFDDPNCQAARDYLNNVPVGCGRPVAAIYLGTNFLIFAWLSFLTSFPKSSK